ncbi:hypothetical protein Q7P37_008649 [Cladosporium fusiforme]
MPEQTRSSSAVRNLRSIFENKASSDQDDSDSRGRSPSSRLSRSDSTGRPLSKIRASFINVQHPTMSSSPPPKDATSKRASAFDIRTTSFTDTDFAPHAISALKQEMAAEQTRRQSNPNIFETEGAVESTGNTPAVEAREDQAMGVIDHNATKLNEMELPPPNEEDEIKNQKSEGASANDKKAAGENEPPANPDKPVTGVEEEQGTMKPALPNNEDAVSGGQALPPVAEDLRPNNKPANGTPKKISQPTAVAKTTPQARSTPQKSVSKPATNASRGSKKPEAIAVEAAQKVPDNSLKSPTSESKSLSSTKSPLSPLGAPKQAVNRKTSRSSLTAPTAASSGRTRRESSSVKPASKPQPREPTKPVSLPSHLTAPTAASRARQEADNAANSKPATSRTSTSTRAPTKPQASTSRPAARSSTAARPESRTTTAPRKSNTTSAPDSSFLERMMRPTAASASKTHDKTAEAKSPPRRTKSVAKRPATQKVNGTAKPAPKAGAVSKPLSSAKAAEAKPTEEKHVEAQPIEEKSIEEKVEEEKPIEEKVEEEKVEEEKPAEEKPVEEKPVEEKPIEVKPTEESPIEVKPIEEKPTEERSAEAAPVQEKPVAEEPAEQKLSEEKPAEQTSEPIADAPKQSDEPSLLNGKVEPTEIPDIPVPATENGHATPKHNTDSEPADAALESTPAFGEDAIR